jgi:hypothetical protein
MSSPLDAPMPDKLYEKRLAELRLLTVRLTAFLAPLSAIDDRIESALRVIDTTITQDHNLLLLQDATKGEGTLRETMFTVLIDRLPSYPEVHTIRDQFDIFWDALMNCCQKEVMPYESAEILQQSGE